ncbi:MAG: hypothetical protein ABSH31_07245 [Bryobacteraceae bacterium]|jgi:hypothetical protein
MLCAALEADPYLGRRSRVEGTRELPLPPLPFLIVYRVLEQKDAIRNSLSIRSTTSA